MMEAVMPVMDFDFNSARSSPRSTAPPTPRPIGACFFSAPTSPTKMSKLHREFDKFSMMGDMQRSRRITSLSIPFDWEEKPGTPKSPRRETNGADDEEEGDDFAFDFSEALEKTSLPAEELFDKGKIKPLKPPPRLQSPRSPTSQGRKFIREAFSPRKKKERDPFAAAIETSQRGRERVQDSLSKNSSRGETRSLSPYRVSQYPWEEEEEKQHQNESSTINKPSSSRKWRLRDFFLFRSASEGHATDKNRLRNKISSLKSTTYRQFWFGWI